MDVSFRRGTLLLAALSIFWTLTALVCVLSYWRALNRPHPAVNRVSVARVLSAFQVSHKATRAFVIAGADRAHLSGELFEPENLLASPQWAASTELARVLEQGAKCA